MKLPRAIIGVTLSLAIAAAPLPLLPAQQIVPSVSARTVPVTSSTSASGQFIVYGADLTTRGAFCMLADETAAALGRLLRDGARYTLPIIVVVKAGADISRTDPAVGWNISQLSQGGFHLQANVLLRSDFRSDDFARDIVRLLIAERILRNHREIQTTRSALPDWVLTGVTQALEFRSRSKPSALFAAVFRSGQIYSVDKVLTANVTQLDSLTRGIYETSACALVLALLDQPDGPLRFGKFLGALATENKSDRDLLKQSFPTLGVSKNSLEKWWSLQMAALSTPTPLESLSVTETEERLDDALTLVFGPEPEKKSKSRKNEEPGKSSTKSKKTSWIPETGGAYANSLWTSVIETAMPFLGGHPVGFLGFGKKKDADEDSDDTKAKEKEKAAKAAAEKKAAEAKKKAADKKAAEDAREKQAAKKKADDEKKDKEAAEKKRDEEKKKDSPPTKEKPAKLEAAGHRVGQKPEDLPKTKAEDKKKGEEKDNATEEAGKKSSLWNPLSWFHRHEKPEEEPETAKGEQKSSRKPHSARSETASSEAPSAPPKKRDVERPVGPPIDQYSVIFKRSDRGLILNRNLQQLSALKLQAHPLYRTLIGDYTETVRLIANGKDKGMTAKLAELKARRAKISEEAKAVESYVDWYEASETRTYSGAFDDYMKLRDRLDKEIRTRNDALSKYLDSIEKEFE